MNPDLLCQLSDRELRDLIDAARGVCISLIMPVQQETDKRDMNRIRFKNHIQSAREELTLLDLRRPDIDQLLGPAEGLVKGGRFLDAEGLGLAIYLTQEISHAYWLPYAPDETVTVGPQFQIKPLIPLRLNERFNVLVLSQQEIRLLRATQFTVERIELEGMPQSLAEALSLDDPERQLQWHSQTGAKGDGPRAAIFHGHGAGAKEMHKVDLLRYFQLLDRGISKELANEESPLVLAGVDYLLPIFREASSYGYLIDEEIIGSQQQFSDVEIQQQAWQVVRPFFRKEREASVSLYYQRAGQALASAKLKEIIPAAYQGRVDTLFVASNEKIWGVYEPEASQLHLHSQRLPGDIDLLNLATIYSVFNGGNVYTNQREKLPEEEPLAAIFRY